ncbi:hypothetical protein [Haloechinothrix sp. LS1_15]|uniref:hypothetical protein n=1 Tax=Haloechinothrix sp. LS1_15 TaxID=2652248 RepID=UPI002947ADE3|nr:hypothetical protein [Haloechinothrix sp. LS1_15]MDV6011011.1 hypothetical protein [Haloechinothrix sp. LS1_15]
MSSVGSTPEVPDLPPRPDPMTGKPFPPRGLSFYGIDQPPEEDRGRDLRLSSKPKPPSGMGPVLAWYKENYRAKIGTALSFLIFIAAGGSIAGYFQWGDAFGWVTVWQMWVLLVVLALLPAMPLTFMVYSAGADWLQVQRVRLGVTRGVFVKLYELTKIDVGVAGPNDFLRLWDGERYLERSFIELQKDRRVWDLLYNGILHSMVNGAEVTNSARRQLQLDTALEGLASGELPRTAEVDTTTLSDDEIREVMKHPEVQQIMDVADFPHDSSPAEFREKFPIVFEKHLPGWDEQHNPRSGK